MKKRLLALNILTTLFAFVTIGLISPFGEQNNNEQESVVEETRENIEDEETTSQQLVGLEQEQTTELPTEEETITYPDLYADFTQEEIYMIQRVVETETYTADIDSKMNIASVVFNRLNHPNNKYGDDIIAIITAPNQFAYWRTEISETTIEAIERVYKYGDTTGGCIAYRSDEHPQYWYSWELQFVDSVNHGFYAEIKEGE